DGFYNSNLTETMVTFLKSEGGTHAVADFAGFKPEWVEPILTTDRGWTVYELPPNGQRIAALPMLNSMEKLPISSDGRNAAAARQIMIEAKKLAYADMIHYVGDPRFTPVPVTEMLSKDLADQRAKLIQTDHAACQVAPSEITEKLNARGSETIYMSTIDKE